MQLCLRQLVRTSSLILWFSLSNSECPDDSSRFSSESNGNVDETANSNDTSTSSESRRRSLSPRSSPSPSLENDIDAFFYESDRTVIAPPNTPTPKEREQYDSSPDPSGRNGSPATPSSNGLDLDRALKVSKLAEELRAVLGPCSPAPSTHHESQEHEISFRLHNLGYDDYDRVENWRYNVFHETLMPLTFDDTEHTHAAAAREGEQSRGRHGRINYRPGSFPHKWKYKRARSAPWKDTSGTRFGAWNADNSSSSQTGEERDAILVQRMNLINWQKSPVNYDIPNPKFLQKLFI